MTEILPAVEQKNYTPLLPLQSRLMLYAQNNDSSFPIQKIILIKAKLKRSPQLLEK